MSTTTTTTTTTKKKTVVINLEYMRPTPESKKRSRSRHISDGSISSNDDAVSDDYDDDESTTTDTELDQADYASTVSSAAAQPPDINKYQPCDSDYAAAEETVDA